MKKELKTGDVFSLKKGVIIYCKGNEISLKETGSYVVLKTAYEGGGTGMGPHDVYPDGHHVYAKKLKNNGFWDSNGQEIDFYQSGCFTCMIEPKDIGVIKTMKMSFK